MTSQGIITAPEKDTYTVIIRCASSNITTSQYDNYYRYVIIMQDARNLHLFMLVMMIIVSLLEGGALHRNLPKPHYAAKNHRTFR